MYVFKEWYKNNPSISSLVFNIKQILLTVLLNIAISSLNDSDDTTSPLCTPGSLGVHVANSHFSKINANKGNKGCLKDNIRKI